MVGPRRPGLRAIVRKFVQSRVELQGRASGADPPHAVEKSGFDRIRRQQLEERLLRVDRRSDDLRIDSLALLRLHSDGLPVLHEDAPHADPRPEGCPEMLRRLRHGLRDPTHPALRAAPHLLVTVQDADAVMAEDVGGPGGVGPAEGPDHGLGGEGGLHLLGLEPLVEEVLGAHQEKFPEELFRLGAGEHAEEVRDGHGGRHEGWLYELEDLVPEPHVSRVVLRVGLRETRDFWNVLLHRRARG